MGLLGGHVGDWISVHAQAERVPPRFTVTFTFGPMPKTWAKGHRASTRSWTAVVGLVLLLPFVALVVATLLHGAGVTAPLDWIGSSPYAIVSASVSLFVGIPVALVVNLWRIVRLGVRREPGGLEGLVAVEFAPLHLIVVMAAAAVAVLFVGHLAADSYACLNGVHSAC